VLTGGETVEGFRVEYAPGHASHHVVYLHESTGECFVGDVGGVRVPPNDFTLAPTPPPDIDLERWRASLDLVESLRPERLCLTHFGSTDKVGAQLDRVREWLSIWGERARELDRDAFVAAIEERFGEEGEEVALRLSQAAPADQLYLGLERYWAKARRTRRGGGSLSATVELPRVEGPGAGWAMPGG